MPEMAAYSSPMVSWAPRSMAARDAGVVSVNGRSASAATVIAPLDTASFKQQAYAGLKNVITALDVYKSREDIRLDERKLAQDFGISRTPVREALAQLEREGFVRSVPRRGIYVVRKTRAEVIELITAWAALESMAARLITTHASNTEIDSRRSMNTID